jgi:hypothetical protein
MTQNCFDFSPKPNEEAKNIQEWVEKHNQKVIMAARAPSIPPGSLLGAIDRGEAKANAVYLLRGVLSQCLRKSMGPGEVTKKAFLEALRGEISVKKTTRDAAFALRDILIKTHPIR